MRAHKNSVDKTKAALIADAVFAVESAQLTYAAGGTPEGTGGGEVESRDYPGYAYSIEYTELDPEGAEYLVKVTVKWLTRGRERAEVFETVMFRRPW